MRTHISIILTLILALPSIAQENNAFSLAQAQEYAIKNSNSVANAEYDELTAKLQTDAILGIGLPQINGSVQYQNFIQLPVSIIPGDFFGMPGQDVRIQFGVPQQMTAGISASQLLFNGSWIVGLKASSAYAQLMSQQVTKSHVEVKKAVAEAYHLVVIAIDGYELLKASQATLSQLVAETSALNKEGFTESTDVEQLQLSLNDINNQIIALEQQIALSKDLLKFTMGMPLANSIELTDKADALLLDSSGELTSTPFSLDADINYQLTKSALGMQELNLKNQKAQALPTLAAFYNVQTQALRREFDFADTAMPWFPSQVWGVSLNVPIFTGGQRYHNIKIAEVEVKRTNDLVKQTANGLTLQYNRAKTNYDAALKSYELAQSSLSLAQSILNKTEIKFKEGMSSSFEVTQATSQVLQAKSKMVQAMLDLMNAKIALAQSLNKI